MIVFISGFIIFAGLLSYFQIRYILQKEGIKEAVAYLLLMSLAVMIGSLLIAGVKIPSHNVLISKIFEPVGKAILGK
jgi:hypothetical protein